MEQRFGRRGLSIDPMGRFPGEISPAREIYIYIERRVSWAEVEWLRGKTRTGKSYALWFAVHSPLLALHRQPNNITCCTGPRDPSSVQTSSRAQNYRAPLAPAREECPVWRMERPAAPSYEFHLSRTSISCAWTRPRFGNSSFSRVLWWICRRWPTTCARIVSGFCGIPVICSIEGEKGRIEKFV